MKKLVLAFAVIVFSLQCAAKAPKYVFFFIGDGMGANIVNYTQLYKASVNGQHGMAPLAFTEFPVVSFASTWSANSRVTDSAASGTALATGVKTNNAMISVEPDGTRLETVAELAKSQGRKVAVVTTVGVNHATPAVFSAHQPSRKNLDQIFQDQIAEGFDFYGGSKVLKSSKNKVHGLDPMAEYAKAGYTVVRSRDEFKEKSADASKIAFIPDKKHPVTLAIDRTEGCTTLSDMVSSSIEFLMQGGCKKGFFIMAEGGEIDHGTHGNDAASAVREILDLEDAVRIAIEFYKKHPGETAIIVTSDHDTGGCSILAGKSNPTNLQWQKQSAGKITSDLRVLMKDHILSWEETKDFLSERTGLWTNVNVTPEDEAELRAIYDETVAKSLSGDVTDEYKYNSHAVIVAKAKEILNKYSGIVWTTRSHSAAFVPFYYIGPHTELFSGMMDNALIGRRVKDLLKK